MTSHQIYHYFSCAGSAWAMHFVPCKQIPPIQLTVAMYYSESISSHLASTECPALLMWFGFQGCIVLCRSDLWFMTVVSFIFLSLKINKNKRSICNDMLSLVFHISADLPVDCQEDKDFLSVPCPMKGTFWGNNQGKSTSTAFN